MKCLWIDMASQRASFAAVSDTETIQFALSEDRITDQEAVERIKQCVSDAQWDFTDLTHIACTTGPGGFMNLRIGVTAANTLAHELKIPLAGIHLSDVWSSRSSEKDFVWLHSTKKEELFVRGFGTFQKQFPESTLLRIDAFLNEMKDPFAYCGELIPDHTGVIGSRGTPLLVQELSKILPELLSHVSFAKTPIEPWYGRTW